MFRFIKISDFAIIQGLELELGPGLTVLSGETGAGKSIILAAVNLLLGQRAAGDLIRQGSDQAVVEALFDLRGLDDIAELLDQAGLTSEDGDLVVRRVVSRQGRNRVQVSGSLATLGALAEIGPRLVSVSGQHSSQELLRAERHLELLDQYAGLSQSRQEVGRAVGQVRELESRIGEAEAAMAQREARRDFLEHQVEELTNAALDPAEEQELKDERRVLANAEQIASLSENALQGLYIAEGSALEVLGRVRSLLADLSKLDPRAAGFSAKLEEAFYTLEDAAADLRSYQAGLSFDPGRLDWVEGRLLEIQRITRKYGGSAAAALEALEEARVELATLQQGQGRLAGLRQARDQALTQALRLAEELSAGREEAAGRLARAVEAELGELSMEGCQFQVELGPPSGAGVATARGLLTGRGLEQAEFLIAPNPGEGLRRLSRIASGGELSRILLAVKGVTAQGRSAPTLIFDEVDQGIGGLTGSVVGAKLAALSRSFQVICITHLPQIAAWADYHFAVEKHIDGQRTQTVLRGLDEEGRVAEMARMLGASESDPKAMAHARQMLADARQAKPAA